MIYHNFIEAKFLEKASDDITINESDFSTTVA